MCALGRVGQDCVMAQQGPCNVCYCGVCVCVCACVCVCECVCVCAMVGLARTVS